MAQSKERRWLVRISVSVPAEVALEQWTEQKEQCKMLFQVGSNVIPTLPGCRIG